MILTNGPACTFDTFCINILFSFLLLTSTRWGLASHQVVHLGTQDAQTNQNENSEGAQHYDRVKVK